VSGGVVFYNGSPNRVVGNELVKAGSQACPLVVDEECPHPPPDD